MLVKTDEMVQENTEKKKKTSFKLFKIKTSKQNRWDITIYL